MRNNSNLKKVFTIIAVPILGFILLNLTFILNALFQTILNRIFPFDYNATMYWIPISKRILFVLIIMVISWFIFRTKKIKEWYKAVYAVVPTAVVFVTLGIFLYRWQVALYSISALIYAAIILYLYKTKKSWIFYYSVTLVAVALMMMGILGIDI